MRTTSAKAAPIGVALAANDGLAAATLARGGLDAALARNGVGVTLGETAVASVPAASLPRPKRMPVSGSIHLVWFLGCFSMFMRVNIRLLYTFFSRICDSLCLLCATSLCLSLSPYRHR